MTKTELNSTLIDVLSKQGNNENIIQKTLEENPELIPLPFLLNHSLHFNLVIKKLTLPNGQITDFAYLTKSSVAWDAVLIELESSNKKIFTNNKKNIIFHSDFNNAYDQITSWKLYLVQHPEEFKNQNKPLFGHMADNPLSFKFVLIIGRNSDLSSQNKKNMFGQKNTNYIRVMTYDSLINYLKCNSISKKILVSKNINTYKILNLNNRFTGLFAHVGTDHVSFDEKIRKELIENGYNIRAWESGKLLAINDKEPL